MLIRSTANHVLAQIKHWRAVNGSLPTLTHRNVFFFSQDADSQLYDKYLQSQQTGIRKSTPGEKFKFQAASIPRRGAKAQEIQEKLNSEWKGKKLALNIDPSPLIGSRRLLMKAHLEQNVYKGLDNPDALFTEVNPSVEIAIEEIKFDENNFFCGDPIAKQIIEANADLPDQKQDQILQDALATAYEKEPDRLAKRLKSVLNVPEPYLKLVELAMLNENPIYFCGINEYSFRNLLSKYLTLSEVREIFMLSLKYAEAESYKEKMRDRKAANLEERYQTYARELIYLNYFKIIKKVENGEIVKRIASIAREDGGAGRPRSARKTSSQGRKQSNVVLIGHEYTTETLQDYIMIKNLESFTLRASTMSTMPPNSLNSPSPSQKGKAGKSTENDAQKVEKHAILQAMLGSLWNQPYTLNKFPYLSQDFGKLSEEDKKYVNKLYKDHLAKYTGAKRVFYQTNVAKIEKMDVESPEYANLKIDFEEKRKEYEKVRDNLQRKIAEKRKLDEAKGEDRVEEDYKEYKEYKASYEEDENQLHKIKEQVQKQVREKAKPEEVKEKAGEGFKVQKARQRGKRTGQNPTH